jgi:HlyD family secretion protein
LIKLTGTVDAPVRGIVTEIASSPGDVVTTGRAVVRIASLDKNSKKGSRKVDLDALLFVGAVDGNRIREGHITRVEPSVTKKEEFGAVNAKVRAVSLMPMSTRAIAAILHNDGLVKRFSKNGAPMMVRADLILDKTTRLGLSWTGGKGPNFQILPGTPVTAVIYVRHQRPITLILPFLKSVLGIS